MESISDWHVHLDLTSSPMTYVSKLRDSVCSCLCVTTSPTAWRIASEKFVAYDKINVALGLHPELAKSKINELALFNQYSRKAKFIGEIGLDGKASDWETQVKVFSSITDILSAQKNKIISIHSRAADTYVIDFVERLSRQNFVIMHWFSGSISNMKRLLNLNCYFSINPAMCKSKSGIDKIKVLPLNKILFESDFPFSSVSGTVVEPNNLYRIYNNISQILSIDKDVIIEHERENTNRLLFNSLGMKIYPSQQ